jgi:hypothetical protein
MVETVEINNNTNKPICVSIVRSKFSGRLFVKIHNITTEGTLIMPNQYDLIEVKDVEY